MGPLVLSGTQEICHKWYFRYCVLRLKSKQIKINILRIKLCSGVLTHDVPLLVKRVDRDEVSSAVVAGKELALHPGVIPGQLGVHNQVAHPSHLIIVPSLLIVTFI